MKKFFRFMGILILLCISFFYTEKTASVVKNFDDIMMQIKYNKERFFVKPIEAIIDRDTIIPGINGREVDVDNSYREMRYIGKYNSKYLIYKPISVKNKLEDNINKYIISGNTSKKKVTIIFLIDKKDDINYIIESLKMFNISSNFFLEGKWVEKYNNEIYKINQNNHIIGTIGYNYSYNDSSYVWLDNIIKKVTKQPYSYCIKSEGMNNIDLCARLKNFTIDTEIIDSNFLKRTKELLKNGYIYVYDVNGLFYDELDLIIKYIKSRDYEIVNINKLLEE